MTGESLPVANFSLGGVSREIVGAASTAHATPPSAAPATMLDHKR
jgi:hypothetical protein